jgi:hypothetical protein
MATSTAAANAAAGTVAKTAATTAAATSTGKAAAAINRRGPAGQPRARHRLKSFDIVITLVAILAVGLSAAWAYAPGAGEARVVVQGRDGEWIYPLSGDREIDVAGPLGLTRVEIRGKSARIEDSPCPNQTCVASGAIETSGQWIACLPNEVLVRIEGGSADAGVDASTY